MLEREMLFANVRRAAELCEALSSPVPGLSQDCLEYIKGHPSNVYDLPPLHSSREGCCFLGKEIKLLLFTTRFYR